VKAPRNIKFVGYDLRFQKVSSMKPIAPKSETCEHGQSQDFLMSFANQPKPSMCSPVSIVCSHHSRTTLSLAQRSQAIEQSWGHEYMLDLFLLLDLQDRVDLANELHANADIRLCDRATELDSVNNFNVGISAHHTLKSSGILSSSPRGEPSTSG
jgi:hypothetical protein